MTSQQLPLTAAYKLTVIEPLPTRETFPVHQDRLRARINHSSSKGVFSINGLLYHSILTTVSVEDWRMRGKESFHFFFWFEDFKAALATLRGVSVVFSHREHTLCCWEEYMGKEYEVRLTMAARYL